MGKATQDPNPAVKDVSTGPTIMEEAEGLVAGERLKYYGPPHKNFRRIARLWTAYLDCEVSEQDVCAMMILLKQARMRTGGAYHRDSAVDTCGYARLQEILEEPLEEFLERVESS